MQYIFAHLQASNLTFLSLGFSIFIMESQSVPPERHYAKHRAEWSFTTDEYFSKKKNTAIAISLKGSIFRTR